DRLVMLWEENPDFHWHEQTAAPANFLDWREQVHAFRDVAAYEDFVGTTTLTGHGEPRLLTAISVTGNFFDMLGVRADQGRVLRNEETWDAKGAPVAVLSYRAWRDVFNADRALVGHTVQLGGRAVEIAGVLPESYAFPGLDADVVRPVAWDPADRSKTWFRRAHFVRAIARVRPEVTIETANAELQSVASRLKREYPLTNAHMGAGLTPLHDFITGPTRRPLLVLLGAVSLLLLIACANVGNLLLVRAAGRQRESALRLALGARHGRLIRQALTESLVLSALGGAAGLALGWSGARVLAALQPADMLPVKQFALDLPVLAYVFAATTIAGLLFGIAPALWTGRRAPAEVLKDEGRTASAGWRVRRLGDLLVVAEVALALTLTVGSGLLVRSYLLLQRVDAGFDARGVLTVQANLPGIRFDSVTKVIAFYEELRQRAGALSGVEAAAIVSQPPATHPPWSSEFSVEGRGEGPRGSNVVHREISPGYQAVMHVPLLAGRLFTDADRRGSPYVVLINQALARAYFRDEDPIGKRVSFDRVPDSTSTWRTIVGVVGNERQAALADEASAEFLAPYQQEARSAMTLVLRTGASPASLAPAVRRIVREMDPELALTSVRTMEEVRSASMARDRFLTTLFLAFAMVGAALAMVGVYGMVAQLARRRTREMGIRAALGARGRQIQWLVLRHGLVLTGFGVATGLVGAFAGARAMRALLYHVAPADTFTFLTVPLLLMATAGAAAWLPAVRASRVDPAEVLRAD
ncbi:MAG: ABC transporter permease, partial [Gemmatimonadales bacterium]